MSNTPPTACATLCNHIPGLPRTALIDHALDHARDHMPDYLFNHVTRSWIFSSRIAARNAIQYDAEVVAVSTLLHDIGLMPMGQGPNRFEVNGAIFTADVVRRFGFDGHQTQLVWDSIALHATSSRRTTARVPRKRSTTSLRRSRASTWSSASRPAAATRPKRTPKRSTTTSSASSASDTCPATRRRPWWTRSSVDRIPNEPKRPFCGSGRRRPRRSHWTRADRAIG